MASRYQTTHNKTINSFLTLFQDNPGKQSPGRSAVLEFQVAPMLSFPLHANPVLKYTGWHARRQYHPNGTLK